MFQSSKVFLVKLLCYTVATRVHACNIDKIVIMALQFIKLLKLQSKKVKYTTDKSVTDLFQTCYVHWMSVTEL